MMPATGLDIATAPLPLSAKKGNEKSGTDFLLTDLMLSPVCSHIFEAIRLFLANWVHGRQPMRLAYLKQLTKYTHTDTKKFKLYFLLFSK